MKLSVVTACFRSAGLLDCAIQSVLSQTWPDVEYLVIDGGSMDGTVDLLRRWEAEFNGKLRWTSEPDDGMYDAINKGIRMATGDVIGILNADDFFQDDDVLARVAEVFEHDSQLEVVYGDIRFVRSLSPTRRSGPSASGQPSRAREWLRESRELPTRRYYSARHWRPWMLRWGYMPPHPGVYIRREAFERLGLYKTDYRIAADYELLIRFLWKGSLRARYLPESLVAMRPGGKSTRNWQSNVILNSEIVRGNRENGIYTNLFMLLPKYAFKVWEFALPALRSWSGK
jgi:glycosyltransferase involved in cell wall biosynthesis